MLEKKLYRRTTHKYITGLAGGIADYFDLDATVIRVVFICLGVATLGLLLIAYFVVSHFVPQQPTSTSNIMSPPTFPPSPTP